jgi:deoxyribodipyrimidine photo-lyase
MNFVFYEPDYDKYSALPEWAKKTLAEHKGDRRDYVYSRSQLEGRRDPRPLLERRHAGDAGNRLHAQLHADVLGQKDPRVVGDAEEGFDTTLRLNNTYFLDGRDANSFANVAWVFGQHDRGWTERVVYGKVRYLSAGGLERKAKPKAYVEKVDELVRQARNA